MKMTDDNRNIVFTYAREWAPTMNSPPIPTRLRFIIEPVIGVMAEATQEASNRIFLCDLDIASMSD